MPKLIAGLRARDQQLGLVVNTPDRTLSGGINYKAVRGLAKDSVSCAAVTAYFVSSSYYVVEG